MKGKAHTVYKTKSGLRVPGCTTISGLLDKPALKFWANKLGLDGFDVRKYVDDLADIGTIAHQMCTDWLLEKKTNTDDYSKNQISLAENCALKFFDWIKNIKYKIILIEQELVSEDLLFGGTPDLFLQIDEKNMLIDIKTAKDIYDNMETQVAGYKLLLEEHGYTVDECRILRLGRDESEGFDYKKIENIGTHVLRFKNLREQYDLNKLIAKGK